jgi:hypothetical protein
MNLPTSAERAAAAEARELARQDGDQSHGDEVSPDWPATRDSDDGQPESSTAQDQNNSIGIDTRSALQGVQSHSATGESSVASVRWYEHEPVPTYEETMQQDEVRYASPVREGASGVSDQGSRRL